MANVNSSLGLISRLAQRFDNSNNDRVHPDFLTRDMGGHNRVNQPFISGYFQGMFGLPELLFNGAERASKASQWLTTTLESFQPHTRSNNKADLIGQGGIGSSFPVSTTIGREFTCAFREYQNMPMINIFNQWSSFFDPHTGVSPLPGNLFIPKNYKGWAAILQTKPVRSQNHELRVEDVEEVHFYCGTFPLNVPTETAGQGDVGANDLVQLSVSFSFDGAPMTSAEPGVSEKVISLFNGMHMLGTDGYVDSNSTYNRYLESAVSDLVQQFGSNRGTVTSAADPSSTQSPSGTW